MFAAPSTVEVYLIAGDGEQAVALGGHVADVVTLRAAGVGELGYSGDESVEGKEKCEEVLHGFGCVGFVEVEEVLFQTIPAGEITIDGTGQIGAFFSPA